MTAHPTASPELARSHKLVRSLALARPDPTVRFGAEACERVLFACYGPNMHMGTLCEHIVEGRDPTIPFDSIPVELPYDLCFGQEGAAFIRGRGTGSSVARAWKVSRSQFLDVFQFENKLRHSDLGMFDAKWAAVLAEPTGEATVAPYNWYGKLVYVGGLEGLPVLTFTVTEIGPLHAPNARYAMTICDGLRDGIGWDLDVACEYLAGYPGADRWHATELAMAVRAEHDYKDAWFAWKDLPDDDPGKDEARRAVQLAEALRHGTPR